MYLTTGLIIKKVSELLSNEEWNIIDITLKEFNLPIENQWNGEKSDYITTMIENASDSQLIELGKHLDIQLNEVQSSTPKDPEFWKENCFKLFLSHLSSYKKETAELQKALDYYGVSAFVAHEDIKPTKEWQTEIEVALETMDGLVALLTPGFNKSNWTDQEVGFAIGKKIPIISIRLGQDPYGFIGKFQGLQGFGKSPEHISKEIVEILIRDKSANKNIVAGLTHSFIDSNTFAEAKEKIELIEDATHVSEELLLKLEHSVKDNSQIRDSWGVPETIKKLCKKFRS